MLSIFVCEDEPTMRGQITGCIKDYIQMENFNMEVAQSSALPADILGYLDNHKVAGLYFLDLDLGHETDGLKLAEEIRKYDPRGFIVFVTADAESHTLTFKYKVEAMDYIVKSDINLANRICECIRDAYGKFTAKSTPLQDTYVVKLVNDFKGRVATVERSKILYFETSPGSHNIVLYTENARYEFRGSLSKIENELDERFVRCHRAFIVNSDMIYQIDKSNKILHLRNGDTIEVASRYIKKLDKLFFLSPVSIASF